MRVLQLIDRLRPIGGVERLQRTFAEGVQSKDVDVVFATLFENDAATQNEIEVLGPPVVVLAGSHLLDPRRFLKLRRLLRAHRTDVIHTHLVRSTLVGALAGRISGIPVVTTLHNSRHNPRLRPILRRAETWVLKEHVARVVACGWETANAHQGRIGGNRIDVIPNATLGVPPLRPEERAATRRELGVAQGETLLISVGRLHRQKGFHDLLQAFSMLLRRHPKAHLVIAGSGELEDNLRIEIKRLELENRARLLGARNDIPRLLGASDLYVSASHWEGLPVATLEAMSAGLPVVATNVGDLSRVVSANCGLLVPAGKPQSLADAAARLLDDVEKARRMGDMARGRVLAQFGVDIWTDRLLALYAKVSAEIPRSSSIRAGKQAT